jgi:hypothetical protein
MNMGLNGSDGNGLWLSGGADGTLRLDRPGGDME